MQTKPEGSVPKGISSLHNLNARSREVLRLLVESYLENGEPVGSRTLSRRLTEGVSPATIRNVMSDLVEQGFLCAPHISAGRLPTGAGLRLFVNGLLEVGNLSVEERKRIEVLATGVNRPIDRVLDEAISLMSDLGHCAGLVMAPKIDSAQLRHIEFVNLGVGRALVVLVNAEGVVENRVIDLPQDVTPSMLVEAGNYMAARMVGRSMGEACAEIEREILEQKAQLDRLTTRVVQAGLATWSGKDEEDDGVLIIRGQNHLLEDVTAMADLETIRSLFQALEARRNMLKLLRLSRNAEGVQIFIGAENELFSVSGCSMIIAPYRDMREQVVGAIGVVGPMRMNYAHIVPMVDYTARVVSKLLGKG